MRCIESIAPRAIGANLDRSRLYDWTMRVPVVGYSLMVLRHDVLGFWAQLANYQVAFQHTDGAVLIAVLARVSQWTFIASFAILPVFRLAPICKSDRFWPRLVALAAVGLIPLFMLLDRAPANLAFNSASLLLGITANITAIVTISFLGRSLSVMPEARRLIMDGPYTIVRHPLYLCEMLGVTAMMLQYRSLAAIGLFVVIVAVQITRGRAEDAVLASAFAEFSAYRSRTPFLLPRDFAKFFTAFVVDPVMRWRSALVMGGTLAASATVLFLLPLLTR